jgi:hypothetical protein
MGRVVRTHCHPLAHATHPAPMRSSDRLACRSLRSDCSNGVDVHVQVTTGTISQMLWRTQDVQLAKRKKQSSSSSAHQPPSKMRNAWRWRFRKMRQDRRRRNTKGGVVALLRQRPLPRRSCENRQRLESVCSKRRCRGVERWPRRPTPLRRHNRSQRRCQWLQEHNRCPCSRIHRSPPAAFHPRSAPPTRSRHLGLADGPRVLLGLGRQRSKRRPARRCRSQPAPPLRLFVVPWSLVRRIWRIPKSRRPDQLELELRIRRRHARAGLHRPQKANLLPRSRAGRVLRQRRHQSFSTSEVEDEHRLRRKHSFFNEGSDRDANETRHARVYVSMMYVRCIRDT